MNETRRIVFLDIDGVLNDSNWISEVIDEYERAGTEPDDSIAALAAIIDPERVERLNRIVAGAKAEVVASTSWREVMPIADLTEALRRNGFAYEIVDATPLDPTGRGRQIAAWLSEREDVAAFAILDDATDMEPVEEYAIQTYNEVGLTEADVARAIAMLRREDDEVRHVGSQR